MTNCKDCVFSTSLGCSQVSNKACIKTPLSPNLKNINQAGPPVPITRELLEDVIYTPSDFFTKVRDKQAKDRPWKKEKEHVIKN